MPKITNFECPKADWVRVLNKTRRTAHKEPLGKEPSDSFKRQILLAEHSPIRLLEYDFTIEDVRQWVTVHLVRHHVGCEKFVGTQRGDRNPEVEELTSKIVALITEAGLEVPGWKPRDYLFQGAPNEMDMSCNAQAFISISRKRLCHSCPSPETREVWKLVIEFLSSIDPILAEKCVPECVYRGFCPEFTPCGYAGSPAWQAEVNRYRYVGPSPNPFK